MKKKLQSVHIERFLEGDLRLEGPCANFQGRIAFLSRIDSEPDSLKILLSPLAEKTPDERRWKLSQRESWELKLSVTFAKEEGDGWVVFETTEKEKVTFFVKGGPQQLNFEFLREHDIEIPHI